MIEDKRSNEKVRAKRDELKIKRYENETKRKKSTELFSQLKKQSKGLERVLDKM